MYKIILTIMVFAGCRNIVQPDLSGIYTRSSESQFSRAFDTLIVYSFDAASGACLVRRQTGIIRILEGVPQPEQWRAENMNMLPDKTGRVLQDSRTGRTIMLKDGELLFGTATYKRIK